MRWRCSECAYHEGAKEGTPKRYCIIRHCKANPGWFMCWNGRYILPGEGEPGFKRLLDFTKELLT